MASPLLHKSIREVGVSILILLSLYSTMAWADLEDLAKAKYLEHFANYTEWPDSSSLGGGDQPFTLCVIGKNPFGSQLDKLYADRKIKKRPVKVLYLQKIGRIRDCHLLFISGSLKKNLPEILAITSDLPILTIGDTRGYAKKGVLVKFYRKKRKLRFEINYGALQDSGLQMSYKILRLARLINKGDG